MFSIFGKNLNELQNALSSNGYIDKMYEAVSQEDSASAIRVALEIVQQTNVVPTTKIKRKSTETARAIKDYIEKAFQLDQMDEALVKCNEMLLLAPKHSEEMFFAYYLRANILIAVKAPVAGLSDIEACFAVDVRPSAEIIRGLLDHRKELTQLLPFENLKNVALQSSYGIDYFTLNVKRNKDVPCVSADVIVVKENDGPKVVAAKKLEIGKVVAVERAFVAEQDEDNSFISCYHCLKFSFNLIPCDGCCYAMFCDESCKRSSMYGYHKIECPIMDYIYSAATTTRSRLAVKAAIKIKQSQSWDEVIAASRNLGADLPTSGSDGEIYSSRNALSVLHFTRRKHFVHGKMFNQSLLYATIVDKLSLVPNFYPRDQERKLEAMCALGNIMVQLFIHFPFEIKIINSAQNYLSTTISSEPEPNFGWFSFANKLSHCCEPNLLAVGLNDKIALVVLKPINKGEELTICHMGHYYENVCTKDRQYRLFASLDIACECRVCVKNWTNISGKSGNLSAEQKLSFRKWRTAVTSMHPDSDRLHFKATCQMMTKLQDQPNTTEHQQLFRKFRDSLHYFQYSVTQNNVILNSNLMCISTT